ncbi:hypothetical protein LINPERPRIM_LOCUS21526 [Linum perenne]
MTSPSTATIKESTSSMPERVAP